MDCPGPYTTGCTEQDHECMGGARERPKQKVVIDHGFWMDTTEVTQGGLSEDHGYQSKPLPQPKTSPVEQVD
jgi:hypothetical protein